MREHEIAELVNRLTAIAREYGQTEQLRERIAHEIRPLYTPPGCKLVPSFPTEAMVQAGGHVNSEWLNDNAPIGEARYHFPVPGVWAAMLAAAPELAEEKGAGHD